MEECHIVTAAREVDGAKGRRAEALTGKSEEGRRRGKVAVWVAGGAADVICKPKGLLAQWADDSWQLREQAVHEELGRTGAG